MKEARHLGQPQQGPHRELLEGPERESAAQVLPHLGWVAAGAVIVASLAVAWPRGAGIVTALCLLWLGLRTLVRAAARAVGVPGPAGVVATSIVVTGLLATVLTLAAGVIAIGVWLLVGSLHLGERALELLRLVVPG